MIIERPPMGWNSWNTFGPDISDTLIRETADAMVETGLLAAGYEYLVIDDCWSLHERDAEGRLVPDPEKFPHGMKALADYVHSKGLKFGMYSCNGPRTCAGYPGSFDHEFIDAATFAEWGVDYLKYDNCYKPALLTGRFLYNRMSMALKATGRDIVFSACNWGHENVQEWIRSTGAHLYRSTGDIFDTFKSVSDIAKSQFPLLGYSAPGCYNDMDMLICGMYGKGNVAISGCTDEEYRTHFALWCFCGVPLMIGCDVRNMSEETAKLLKDRALLSLVTDDEARPPFLVTDEGETKSFLRHLERGEYAIGYFNFADEERRVRCEFFDMGLTVTTGYAFDLTDIRTGERFENVTEYLDFQIPAHGSRILRGRLVPQK